MCRKVKPDERRKKEKRRGRRRKEKRKKEEEEGEQKTNENNYLKQLNETCQHVRIVKNCNAVKKVHVHTKGPPKGIKEFTRSTILR